MCACVVLLTVRGAQAWALLSLLPICHLFLTGHQMKGRSSGPSIFGRELGLKFGCYAAFSHSNIVM